MRSDRLPDNVRLAAMELGKLARSGISSNEQFDVVVEVGERYGLGSMEDYEQLTLALREISEGAIWESAKRQGRGKMRTDLDVKVARWKFGLAETKVRIGHFIGRR